MANTLINIPLPANTWVDMYAGTGIAIGTQIVVESVRGTPVYLTEKVTQPGITDGYSKTKDSSRFSISGISPEGAWAFSPDIAGLIQVSEAE